ncbi:MAG: hypothetical protein B6247_29910 [Candidatus Parabeggiatoa sp. nov. 2]|nr:MAG: hypothetical protein B6247_29910 [Beggiatoa sp. 4572_84]
MNKLSKFMSFLTFLFLSVNGLAETDTSQTIGATSAKSMPDKIVVTGKQKVVYCGTRVTKPRPLTYFFSTNVAPYSRGSAEWCQKGKQYLITENIRTWPMEKGLLGCPELDTGEYQVPKLHTGEYHVIEQLTLTATTLAGEALPALPANFKNDYQPVHGTVQISRTEGTPIYSSYNEHRANGRHAPGTGYCWFGPGSTVVDGVTLPPMSLKVDWVADINWETEDIIEYSKVYTSTALSENETPSLDIDCSDSGSLTTDCGENTRSGQVGDPIDTATGAQDIQYTLLNVQGVLPISFTLSYNSLLLQEGKAGIGWGLNSINASLEEIDDSTVKVHWSANQFNRFTKDTNGEYRSDISTVRLDKVLKNPDGSFTLTRQNQTIYEFSAAGQLTQLRNPRGQVLVFEYDDAGELAKIVEPLSGVFLQYTYNADGLLETVSDSLDRQVTLGYDDNRYLTTLTNANGETTTFAYNDIGQILTAILQDGTLLFSNTYDEQGRVNTQDDGIEGNQLLTLSYDESQADKFITTVTDRMGETRIYTYNNDYKLLTLQDEAGHLLVTNTYNPDGSLATATDVKGNTTHFEYDANGNLTKITDAKGGITQMVYDANSNLLSVTNALGKTSTFSYDANNNRMSATDALGNTTRYTYNSDGQVLTTTSPSGAVSSYEYENGLPVRVTDPEGNTQTLRYDAVGRLSSTTDAEGHTTTFAYDGVNRLVLVTDALNRTVSMTYDSRDNLLTLTDAKGHVTRRNYDGNGNLISQINALAQETRYEYDGEGRLVKVIDAKGHVTQLGYDAKGRLISMTDALGNTQQLSYDAADNLLAAIDALGKTVATYRYDGLNNPLSITNALGHQTQSEYDALGRLTRVTDPLNWATQFNYDDNDRLVASVDAKEGQSRQTFDAEGNLTGLTDPNSHQTTFQFDNNGRLVDETSASGGRVRYSYNARDLLATLTNARGQQRQFEYDVVGRLTSLTDADGTVSYTYDDNDNVLTVTDASGTISREYDALNRVVKYTDSQGNTLQYAYDAVGNLETLTYPDGKQVFYEYDAADQLTLLTDWAGRKTRYAYDANGRLVEVVRPNGTRMTYTYNVAGQLVQQKDVASDGKVIRHKEQVVPEPAPFPFIPATMTYTSANRLATYNGEAVTFDADGNMTVGPLNGELVDFTFDSRNRLSNVGNMAYRYDAENQRIAVSIAGQATRYVINPQAVLSQVLDSPFGGLVSHNPTEVDTPFLYNGRDGVMTDDTGLYYMRARFYNPEIRRFVNRDVLLGSVDDGQSLNRFAYVSGNPVSFVDPFGLAAKKINEMLDYMEKEATKYVNIYEYSNDFKNNFKFGHYLYDKSDDDQTIAIFLRTLNEICTISKNPACNILGKVGDEAIKAVVEAKNKLKNRRQKQDEATQGCGISTSTGQALAENVKYDKWECKTLKNGSTKCDCLTFKMKTFGDSWAPRTDGKCNTR